MYRDMRFAHRSMKEVSDSDGSFNELLSLVHSASTDAHSHQPLKVVHWSLNVGKHKCHVHPNPPHQTSTNIFTGIQIGLKMDHFFYHNQNVAISVFKSRSSREKTKSERKEAVGEVT